MRDLLEAKITNHNYKNIQSTLNKKCYTTKKKKQNRFIQFEDPSW